MRSSSVDRSVRWRVPDAIFRFVCRTTSIEVCAIQRVPTVVSEHRNASIRAEIEEAHQRASYATLCDPRVGGRGQPGSIKGTHRPNRVYRDMTAGEYRAEAKRLRDAADRLWPVDEAREHLIAVANSYELLAKATETLERWPIAR